MRQNATTARPNGRFGVVVTPAFAALFGVED